jgi:hypothetical protein
MTLRPIAFATLASFQCFAADAADKRLSTYVSNGPAGLDFEKRDYAFEGNDLIVMSEETQKPSPSRPGWYVHTVRRRKDGKLVVVLSQTVKKPVTPVTGLLGVAIGAARTPITPKETTTRRTRFGLETSSYSLKR